MSTLVVANLYVHTTTYITDKMLRSILYIIRESGLDPSKFANDWEWMERGIRTWLGTQDLKRVLLKVFDPRDGEHKEVRDVVADTVRVERDFLSGSYARWTKTRPLKDVDVFCVLHEHERSFSKPAPERNPGEDRRRLGARLRSGSRTSRPDGCHGRLRRCR